MNNIHFNNEKELLKAYNAGKIQPSIEYEVNYKGIESIAKMIDCSNYVAIRPNDERYFSDVIAKITPDGLEDVAKPTLVAFVPSEDDRGDMNTLGQGKYLDDDEYCY